VAVAQQIQLAAQGVAGGVAAGVVVAEDAGGGQGQPRQAGGDALLAVAEVAHHQQGIGGDQLQQGLVAGIPLAVQITGDRDLDRPAGRGAWVGSRFGCCAARRQPNP
jgi:hypothetical protein